MVGTLPSDRPAENGISPMPTFFGEAISPPYIYEPNRGGRSPTGEMEGPGGEAPPKIYNP